MNKFQKGMSYNKGENNGRWIGGKVIQSGYIKIKNIETGKYEKRNRLVFQKFYKCSLLSWADVHHINENKQDDRPQNLQGMTRVKHARLGKGRKHNYPRSFIRRGKKYIKKESIHYSFENATN